MNKGWEALRKTGGEALAGANLGEVPEAKCNNARAGKIIFSRSPCR